jgi:hypothetical protein
MNLAPTTIPYITNAAEQILSTCHSRLRQYDQRGTPIIIDMRANIGNRVTSVRLPVKRSPSSSLKSCAWSVVANTAQLKVIARAPMLSMDGLEPGCEEYRLTRSKACWVAFTYLQLLLRLLPCTYIRLPSICSSKSQSCGRQNRYTRY